MNLTQLRNFTLGDMTLYQVAVHFITVKISVVRLARCVVHSQSTLPGNHSGPEKSPFITMENQGLSASSPMSLNRRFMQRWLTIHHHHIAIA